MLYNLPDINIVIAIAVVIAILEINNKFQLPFSTVICGWTK